jgi:hypothetical protein
MTRLLAGLAALAIVVALITPEDAQRGGGATSYSAANDGARISFELARRMGWVVSRRDTPLDSIAERPTAQVVLAPREELGAREVHRLLENVRRGGALAFTVGGNSAISDSLGLDVRMQPELMTAGGVDCRARRPRLLNYVTPPTVYPIVWLRPPPGPVTTLATTRGDDGQIRVVIGFPYGSGRVVAIGSMDLFTNGAVRTCEYGADLAVARAWEYLRPAGGGALPMVFDEYHHGRGAHEGSVSAIAGYLAHTSSGRMFTTLLAAGIVLLLAAAPRPIVPADTERVVRRSPLEHADALGRAYEDVRATRTASARLVSGLRRRAGRVIVTARDADEAGFLDAVARRAPSVEGSVAILRRALNEQLSPHEFAQVADAVDTIEHALLTTPSARA